jgi:putative transcriptional regulator
MLNSGKILLAEPFMLDPFFRRSVILLTEVRNDGSVGFILNKNIDHKITELVEDFPEFEADVFYGGPVATDSLHFIHSVGSLLDDSVPITRGVWWGGDFDKLKFLIEQELVEPAQIRFFVGYAGWGEGQLREEMKLGSWKMADFDPNFLFKMPPDNLWNEVMKLQGNVFEIIGDMKDEANWN